MNRFWNRPAKLAATLGTFLIVATIALLFAGDYLGVGPNLGLPFGYYGRFNQVLERIEANPKVEVLQTTLHQDLELEDFYITVRTQDAREVRLCFEEAHTRPVEDLLRELKKAGL